MKIVKEQIQTIYTVWIPSTSSKECQSAIDEIETEKDGGIWQFDHINCERIDGKLCDKLTFKKVESVDS